MEPIRVRLTESERSYPIYVLREISDLANSLESFISGKRVIILTNAKVRFLCKPVLKDLLARFKVPFETVLIPDGERYKTLSTAAKVYPSLVRLQADRQTLLLLLGGGIVGDLGGLVAATYLRGLSFIQMGTTLVAQVDSSIGGKVGVDLPEGKNLVGAFAQPKAVFSYVPFLKTLSARELRGGLAEVLKYGIIRDPLLFEKVTRGHEKILGSERDLNLLSEIVSKSSLIKASVVSQDEKESSLRMILNFGHTFGHAVEQLTHYRKFLHGEAVGMGMATAARLSVKLGFCSQKDADHVVASVKKVGLPTELPAFSKSQWRRTLEVDKKVRGGMIHFVFMKNIGDVVVSPIDPKELVDAL